MDGQRGQSLAAKDTGAPNTLKSGRPTAAADVPQRGPGPVIAAIDREWSRVLKDADVPSSPEADDAEFVRRACLDITHEPQCAFFNANTQESVPKPSLLTAATSRLFLGVQVARSECHDHPFAEWTQEDFCGLAAFYSRVHKRSKGDFSLTEAPLAPTPGEAATGREASIVIPDGRGKAAGRVVTAWFLDGSRPNGVQGRRVPNWPTRA